MQRHAGEHIHEWAVRDLERLDEIEAVQLCMALCHRGEVPAGWWGWPADPPPAIEQPASLKHAADGPDRWRLSVTGTECRVDRDRPMLPQDALAQPTPKRDDGVLELDRDPAGPVRRPRAVAPVDLLEPAAGRPSDPQLDGRERDPHLARDRTLRRATTDRPDDRRAADLSRSAFCPRDRPPAVFPAA